VSNPPPNQPGAPAAQVNNLQVAYGDQLAVRDLTFTLERGMILGLIGPNGAGKTTILRAMSGILPPHSGRIRIVGTDIEDDPVTAKKSIAYVADDPRLFAGLTVWEHLRFTAAVFQVGRFEAVAVDLLERFSLSDQRDTVCGALSLGMRHKVGICCALLHNPDVLMMDEPLTGLDPRGILTLKTMLNERAAEGKSVIISSHLLGLVEDISTTVLLMKRGRASYLGPLPGLREAFSTAGAETLEEVFLRATEGEADGAR